MKNMIFIVEGYHDVALITKILKINGYKEVKNIQQLNNVFKKILPTKFPFIEDRLNIFNIIPMFMSKGDIQIVVKNANRETNLLYNLDLMLNELNLDEMTEISKVVVFADGDNKNRKQKLESILEFNTRTETFEFVTLDDVSYPNPHINILNKFEIDLDYYIFPDNENVGRLENIIIDSIKESDKQLHDEAKEYVDKLDDKYKDTWNADNSKFEKAIIGVAGNAITPGCSNTTVLYSDETDWISTNTICKVSSLKKLDEYLFEVTN